MTKGGGENRGHCEDFKGMTDWKHGKCRLLYDLAISVGLVLYTNKHWTVTKASKLRPMVEDLRFSENYWGLRHMDGDWQPVSEGGQLTQYPGCVFSLSLYYQYWTWVRLLHKAYGAQLLHGHIPESSSKINLTYLQVEKMMAVLCFFLCYV